jgi:hypothetical protein
VVQRQQTLAADSTFDVEAFFTEVEGKKKPTTIQVTSTKDVQKLAASLLNRCKKPSSGLKAAGL